MRRGTERITVHDLPSEEEAQLSRAFTDEQLKDGIPL